MADRAARVQRSDVTSPPLEKKIATASAERDGSAVEHDNRDRVRTLTGRVLLERPPFNLN